MKLSVAAQEALRLLPLVPISPEDKLPEGATAQQLRDFEQRTQFRVPHQIEDWLLFCNGPNVAEGGVYGIRPDRPFLDIESHLAYEPEWRKNKWLPVAGDGCGNYYVAVLDPDDLTSCPIFFVDHEVDYDELNHQIASDFWTFLHWLFRRELKL